MSKLRLTILCLMVVSLVAVPQIAPAAGPTITGAGSTFSEVAIKQWIGDVANQGLSINYSGVGSTQGRQQYINNKQNIDFAVSEIPFEPGEVEELNQKGLSYQYLPIVAGGTALMYNVKDTTGARITGLNLSSPLAAKIFTGKIKNWNDPEIAAENGDLKLPDKAIKPVVRSDGSGTSAQFSAYLVKTSGSIVGTFFGGAKEVSIWPEFPGYIAQQRSDGVANFVAANENSITYVEAAFAEQRRFPVASVKNASGSYTKPDSGNVALALKRATFASDRTQNLDGVYSAPEAAAYPISSYSYMITPTKAPDITEAEGDVLGKFMIYFACRGQRSADALGYSPLPENLVKGVFDAVRAIPGAPAPPALTAEACPNPNLTGETKPPTAAEPPAPTTTTTAPRTTGGPASTVPGGSTNNSGPASTVPGGGSNPANNSSGGGGSNDPAGTGDTPGAADAAGDEGSGSGLGSGENKPGIPKTGSRGAGPRTTKPKSGATSTAPKTTRSKSTPSGVAKGAAGLPAGTADNSVPDAEIVEGGSTEIGQRLVNLEGRVAALEARAFGTEEVEAALDPQLKDDLLAAAGEVEKGQSGGGGLGIVLLTLIVFAPFLGAASRGLGRRLGRARE